jgi:zinc/manganese transport system substrate-binding protein
MNVRGHGIFHQKGQNSSKIWGRFALFFVLIVLLPFTTLACQPGAGTSNSGKKSIVVTYSVLGSIVKDLVGDQADVTVSIPNGLDPHEWEPSAKDIEAINKADLVVENGMELEGGMEKTLQTARDNGVRFFTVSNHITVRHVGTGEGIPSGDPDQAVGAADPHIWMDPLTMKSVVQALAPVLTQELNLDVTDRAVELASQLDSLNAEVAQTVAQVPLSERKLVTGHESMGYFAQRYDFQLIGVIVPSLSSQAEVSAADLAALKTVIRDNQVKAIFTELGTSPVVAKAIGDETGIKVIELTTHALPSDGSYFTFMRDLAATIVNALK